MHSLSPRAVICDLYHTVLRVEPAPSDREAQWQALRSEFLSVLSPATFATFEELARIQIAASHAQAQAAGIAQPEVFWPDIVRAVVPEAAAWSAERLSDFMLRQAGLTHRISLQPGCADVLRRFQLRGGLLGIASNAQPYTHRELSRALAEAGEPELAFDPQLCFWSYDHGFSKPDPHVFRLLTARLRQYGIAAHETLMIGDRLDNDIEPARAQGWLTWRLAPGDGVDGGTWSQLGTRLGL